MTLNPHLLPGVTPKPNAFSNNSGTIQTTVYIIYSLQSAIRKSWQNCEMRNPMNRRLLKLLDFKIHFLYIPLLVISRPIPCEIGINLPI